MYSTTPWSPSKTKKMSNSPSSASSTESVVSSGGSQSKNSSRRPFRRMWTAHPIRHGDSPPPKRSHKGSKGFLQRRPTSYIEWLTVTRKVVKEQAQFSLQDIFHSEFSEAIRNKLIGASKTRFLAPLTANKEKQLAITYPSARKPPKAIKIHYSPPSPPTLLSLQAEDPYTRIQTDHHVCSYRFCCEAGAPKSCNFCLGNHEDYFCATVLDQEHRETLYRTNDICTFCGYKEARHGNCHLRRRCLYCPLYCHLPALCKGAMYQGMLKLLEGYKISLQTTPKSVILEYQREKLIRDYEQSKKRKILEKGLI